MVTRTFIKDDVMVMVFIAITFKIDENKNGKQGSQ